MNIQTEERLLPSIDNFAAAWGECRNYAELGERLNITRREIMRLAARCRVRNIDLPRMPSRPGGVMQVDWDKVDWSMPHERLAERHGVSPQAVSQAWSRQEAKRNRNHRALHFRADRAQVTRSDAWDRCKALSPAHDEVRVGEVGWVPNHRTGWWTWTLYLKAVKT